MIWFKRLESYSKSGGLIENIIVEAAFYGVMENWINWMVYNINRALNQIDLEQKNIGIEQVMQVLPTILRVKTLMPELISDSPYAAIIFLRKFFNSSSAA